MNTPMVEVTVVELDPDTWLRGTGDGQLFDGHALCCLGFVGLHEGYTRKQLRPSADVSEFWFDSGERRLMPMFEEILGHHEAERQLVMVNDSTGSEFRDDHERVQSLNRVCEKFGLKLRFTLKGESYDE